MKNVKLVKICNIWWSCGLLFGPRCRFQRTFRQAGWISLKTSKLKVKCIKLTLVVRFYFTHTWYAWVKKIPKHLLQTLALYKSFTYILTYFSAVSWEKLTMAISKIVISKMTDNRKYLYLWNYDKQRRNSNGKSGIFYHSELDKSVYDNDRQPKMARLTLNCYFGLSFGVAIVRWQFLRARRGRKPQICCRNFDAVIIPEI